MSKAIIALDAMGGDHAPEAIVEGALVAAQDFQIPILVVGDETRLKKLVQGPGSEHLEIVHASQVVEMDEKPVDALRKKKDSSLSVAVNLVKEGRAGAMVSAGNTGAATAASLLAWRQMPGIHRPAIATLMPNRSSHFLLLDAGASPDVDPQHLVEFALMGMAYAEQVMGKKNPRVHLLNIGEEPGKGNAFAKRVQELMGEHEWFAGNIEGKDLFRTDPDVVVCDAFVGNIVLKVAEGVAEFITETVKSQIPTNKLLQIPYAPAKKLFKPLKEKMDYAEYGGSPLLGLNHLCIISHGRSNARAIRNAIRVAKTAVENDLIEKIRHRVDALRTV